MILNIYLHFKQLFFLVHLHTIFLIKWAFIRLLKNLLQFFSLEVSNIKILLVLVTEDSSDSVDQLRSLIVRETYKVPRTFA